MIKSAIPFLFFFLACGYTCFGQYYQYSQYNYSDQRVNPGSISQSDFATAGFIYRTQRSLADVELNSFMFSAKYPFISRNGGDRWSALGVTFAEDKAGLGGLFETNELAVTYALNFPTGKRSMLSWGNRFNYQSRRINTQNLFTGNQFVPGVGFVGDIDSGEDFGEGNTNFLTISTGISWEKKDKKGRLLAHFGASVFDFNRPDESLLGTGSQLPATSVVEGGLLMYGKGDISIYPEFLYTRTQSTNNLNVGTVTGYKLDRFDRRLIGQEILIHTKYLLNEGFMIGVQWQRGPLSIGTSYDIPINQRVANNGAFELGLELGTLIKSKNKPRRVKRKKSKGKKSKKLKNDALTGIGEKISQKDTIDNNFAEADELIAIPTVGSAMEQNKVDIGSDSSNHLANEEEMMKSKARIGDFKNIRTDEPIYFNFNFGTDEALLGRSDKRTLRDLVNFMKNNPNTTVDIDGHTDDIGDEEYNLKLSRRRAQAVARFLTKNGIERSRLSYMGHGEEKPLVENSTATNRAKNRRVEFVIHHR